MVQIKYINVGQYYYNYVCTFVNIQTKVNGIHQELYTSVLSSIHSSNTKI